MVKGRCPYNADPIRGTTGQDAAGQGEGFEESGETENQEQGQGQEGSR